MKPGPAPLDPATKKLRGTLKPARERRRTAAPATKKRRPAPAPPTPPDYLAVARQYADDVMAGRIVAGRLVRLLVARHVADLAASASPAYPYVWSGAHAVDVCSFVEHLPLALGDDGLLTLQPVQVFLLTVWFGWRLRADDSVRRFRFVHLEVARKFGKSTLCAALALYGLVREGVHGARVLVAATSGGQTSHIFHTAQFMARCDFVKALGVTVYARSIVHAETNSKIEALNSRTHSLHGANPSMVLIDELHEIPHELFAVLRSAFGGRKNPLLMVLTTAGRDVLGIAFETRQRVVKVLDGVLTDDRLSGAIFTLDDGDDWDDERAWPKANPMMTPGPTPKIDELRQLALEAKHTPSQRLSFEQFHCNRWQAVAASAWLNVADIRACADPTLRLDDFIGERAWIGFDSALKDDSASVVILFQRDGRLVLFSKSFLPAESIERYAKLIPEYREWVRAGLLEPTEGAIVDLGRVRDYIAELCEQFHVGGVVVEQFAAGNLPSDLLRLGIPVEVAAKNGRTFTPSALDFEARVRAGKFRFDGNSHATWMLSNACVERRRDGSLLPIKESEKSANKIDVVDAALLAMMPLLAEPEPTEYRILTL